MSLNTSLVHIFFITPRSTRISPSSPPLSLPDALRICRSDPDPGQEPLVTADIPIPQRTGPIVGAINLVPPISVVVQDDPIDAMWARVVGTNDEVVMVVPVDRKSVV